ncbi:hypothetical protein [Cohnella thailandensis]|uniref:Tail tape measure protein n=1 Tax=Cohnella thailandensis TaxID=557557 RepID=A0A841T4W3_9BACL|nr:hypothetical protein [Cohnella thailandensis]MBB6637368.1 hypothetical protein [Cohnella thailandensis]MBP1976697.1 uncharacterized protein YcfJ [Cohnella thailandensis]
MASEQIVIDGNGVDRAGKVFQTTGKFLEQVRKRSEILSRIQVSPMVRLMDLASGPLSQIFSRLAEYAQKQWGISVRVVPASYQGAFAAAGTVAGGVFLNSFLEAFDASKIADKAKSSMDGITVNVKVEGGAGEDKGVSGDLNDILKDTLSGFLGGVLSNTFSEGEAGKKKGKTWIGSALGKLSSSPVKTESPDVRTSSKLPIQSKPSTPSKPLAQPEPTTKKFSLQPLSSSNKSKSLPAQSKWPSGLRGFSKNFNNNGSSNGFANMGFANMGLPSVPGAKQILKSSSKVLRPLAIASDVANIAAAKPGNERNAAIGKAVGGTVGATALGALGTMILPGVGTAIGTWAGGMAGDWVGEKIGANINKIKKLWPFGNKNKKKKAPEAIPEPSETTSARREGGIGPVIGTGMVAGAAASTIYSRTTMGIKSAQQPPAPAPTNVSIMNGAVQLSIQQNQKIDYDAISAQIGAQLAVSIRQSIENRA